MWIIKIKRDDNIDKMWESTCFALIGKQLFSEFDYTGEQFEEPNVIGASLSLRTKERLI